MKLLCVAVVLCALWRATAQQPDLAPWPVVLGINDYSGKGGTDDGIRMLQLNGAGQILSLGSLSTFVRRNIAVPRQDDTQLLAVEVTSDGVAYVSWFVRDPDTGVLDYPQFYYSANYTNPPNLFSGEKDYGLTVSDDAMTMVHSISPSYTFVWYLEDDGVYYVYHNWNQTGWQGTGYAALFDDATFEYYAGIDGGINHVTLDAYNSPDAIAYPEVCNQGGSELQSFVAHPSGEFFYAMCKTSDNTIDFVINRRQSGQLSPAYVLPTDLDQNADLSTVAIDPQGGTVVWIDEANDKIITFGLFAPPIAIKISETKVKVSDTQQIVGTLSVEDPDVADQFQFALVSKATNYFSINGNNELVMEGGAPSGKYPVTIRVTDRAGFQLEDTITVQVTKDGSGGFPKWAIIVIAAVGGVCLSFLIVVIIMFLVRRKKERDQIPVELGELNHADSARLEQIPESQLKVLEKIGGGAFGDVFKGLYLDTVPVALKKLTNVSREEFEQEAVTLQELKHPNVVQFLGICSTSNFQYMVTEFMAKGALLDVLRKEKMELKDLLYAAKDVAAGMAYLESRNIIHRDLAARNLLVAPVSDAKKRFVVKVADFGMSRSVKPESVYESQSDKFPVKWSAPEVLNYRTYTIKSDVWAFGVTMWEIFSRGRMPYGEMSNKDAATYVTGGGRLEQPDCPEEVYKVMLQCWNTEPSQRPTFKEIFSLLTEIITVCHPEAADSNNNNNNDSLYSYDISRASQQLDPPKQDYHNDT